ncbi:zf-TFIIB domain-containing protein [Thermodesulfobacteriota bacterium]
MMTEKFSKTEHQIEDLWFAQREKELLEEIARKRKVRMEEALQNCSGDELKTIREAHWMKCPKCGHDMKNIEIEGLISDKCTFCEGLFFDQGELQQLLEHHDKKKKGIFKKLLGLNNVESETVFD